MNDKAPTPPRLALTPGEPAGIGPDLVALLATADLPAELVVIADPDLLHARAQQLGRSPDLQDYVAGRPPQAGRMCVIPVKAAQPVSAGQPDPANAGYVLATLRRACEGCLAHEFAAMVTGPVHKGVINEAGIPFSGHTEYLAELCQVAQTVMLLSDGNLRVALATTHIPLRAVPAAVTRQRLETVLDILHQDLHQRFGFSAPRIAVLGLNPHAGESGHLGHEEVEIITPVIESMRQQRGWQISGPLPADTAFTADARAEYDAVLAMYHDQGLPVLKAGGFGHTVNITLGLPIVRTSVDHGTALDIAGSGRAKPGSLVCAIQSALDIARRTSV